MRIGIDFDNTIVRYDEVFYRLAHQRGLIPASVAVTKQAVRDSLRSRGKESDWIELQGEVYGARMEEAAPFDGVLAFLKRCENEGQKFFIISHKTETPVAGQPYNLHNAARAWLSSHGIASTPAEGVVFEPKRSDKLQRIQQLGCTHFVDDLSEFLTEPKFPRGVERLLFDPQSNNPPDPRYRRMESWQHCEQHLFDKRSISNYSDGDNYEEATRALMSRAGLSGSFKAERLSGGVNNRVYRIETEDTRFALKIYFSHPNDPRDRLGVETEFANYARSLELSCLHSVVAFDRELNAALYTFVDGRKLSPQDVTQEAIDQAANFIVGLNEDKPRAIHLPIASEASFSIHGHISTIDRRIAALTNGVRDDDAQEFVATEILPAWQSIKSVAIAAAGDRYFEELPQMDRCLSPSDFGFHNAILGQGNKVRFVDFEYAGWDDPAHLFCDFFCQVAVPVSDKYRPFMTAKLTSIVSDPEWFRKRIDILMPVYRIKWCCILLNDFLEVEGKRRKFAGLSHHGDRRNQQLRQSRLLLDTIQKSSSEIAARLAE